MTKKYYLVKQAILESARITENYAEACKSQEDSVIKGTDLPM